MWFIVPRLGNGLVNFWVENFKGVLPFLSFQHFTTAASVFEVEADTLSNRHIVK